MCTSIGLAPHLVFLFVPFLRGMPSPLGFLFSTYLATVVFDEYLFCKRMIQNTPFIDWMSPEGNLARSLPINSSDLFMHARFLDPAGSGPPRVIGNPGIGFHVIKRVASSETHIFRGSITSRHLRHSGLHDSLHIAVAPSPGPSQC